VRYAGQFDGVEVNSSFYHPLRLSTYQRRADDVPDHFRFAVKVPKKLTHHDRLPCRRVIAALSGQNLRLELKLGLILIQLPPSLNLNPEVVGPSLRDSEPPSVEASSGNPGIRHGSPPMSMPSFWSSGDCLRSFYWGGWQGRDRQTP